MNTTLLAVQTVNIMYIPAWLLSIRMNTTLLAVQTVNIMYMPAVQLNTRNTNFQTNSLYTACLYSSKVVKYQQEK
jgi:hypothetical protein